MKAIRWLLGRIILTINFLTPPKGLKRDPDTQAQVDLETANLALYQFNACPFCVKVRRACKRLSINIELRDAKNHHRHRTDLNEQGGKIKTPCLRIEQADGAVIWMYESSDIIQYLEQRFAL